MMNYQPVCLLFFAVLLSIASIVFAASPEVKVIVYDGPTKCTNIEGDEKPNKVEPDYNVGFHFTVTIDESSSGTQDTIGRQIESSHTIGVAPSIPVGQGRVIAGLDMGLIGLCRGSSAYIIVPPHLGYGRMGKPEQGVMGDTTLRYDVEIVNIQPPIPDDFVKIDSNKDWKISKPEAERYFEEEKGQKIDLDALWKEEDKDGDGFIQWEEFSGPKGGQEPPKKKQPPPKNNEKDVVRIFQQMDVNKDGKLSRAELTDAFKPMGREVTDEIWNGSDPDGDGYILFEEFTGKRQTQQPAETENDIGTLFHKMDVNKDGKVSKTELSDAFKEMGHEMTEEFWNESDPDGDGYITFEEFSGRDSERGRGEEL